MKTAGYRHKGPNGFGSIRQGVELVCAGINGGNTCVSVVGIPDRRDSR